VAPFAVNIAELPLHIVAELTPTVGVGRIVTVDVIVPWQLPVVPVTV
jgi:hypothetical protein